MNTRKAKAFKHIRAFHLWGVNEMFQLELFGMSKSLRDRILKLKDEGKLKQEIEVILGVTCHAIYKTGVVFSRDRWTPEMDEQIRDLADRGASASAIASILGDGITRNAVIGRAKRKKIPLMRPKEAYATTRVPKVKRTLKIVLARKEGASLGEIAKAEGLAKVTVARLIQRESPQEPTWDCEIPGPLNCHWPSGDLREGTLRFCGVPIEGGQHHKYCPAHYKLAYQPVRRRERQSDIAMQGKIRDNMRILARVG